MGNMIYSTFSDRPILKLFSKSYIFLSKSEPNYH